MQVNTKQSISWVKATSASHINVLSTHQYCSARLCALIHTFIKLSAQCLGEGKKSKAIPGIIKENHKTQTWHSTNKFFACLPTL